MKLTAESTAKILAATEPEESVAVAPPTSVPAVARSDPKQTPSPTFREHLITFARANPHCRQVLTPQVARHFRPAMLCRPMSELPMSLAPDAPRIPYHLRAEGERSPLHYGQAKLWASEVALLCRHTDACLRGNHVVVYAGAAPGAHIPSLAQMFPTCTFLLYDPAPFCPELRDGAYANVALHNTFFTDDIAATLARKYDGMQLVFVCDIRTGREESYVHEDMLRQARWARALRPLVSMLKFRLPWGVGLTSYFDGTIRLQAYPPLTSTETRLVVTRAQLDAPERAYDNQAYEEQLAYHNLVTRVGGYDHPVALAGLDGCYDCAHLVAVAADYLARVAGAPPPPAAVAALIADSIASFGTGRTLAAGYAPSSTRVKQAWPAFQTLFGR